MGIAYAALAPGAVATAIARWGSAEQQATYLPAFTGEHPRGGARAARATAALRPAEAADQGAQDATAAGSSTASSRSCPRAGSASCSWSRADAEGIGPALFIIESGTSGLLGRSRAGDGPARRQHRPTARSKTSRARPRLLGDADPRRTTSSASSALESHGARLPSAPRQAVLDYVDPLRQRTRGLRRADLQPPGGRLRGLEIAIELDGHAARSPTAPRAAPTGA